MMVSRFATDMTEVTLHMAAWRYGLYTMPGYTQELRVYFRDGSIGWFSDIDKMLYIVDDNLTYVEPLGLSRFLHMLAHKNKAQ